VCACSYDPQRRKGRRRIRPRRVFAAVLVAAVNGLQPGLRRVDVDYVARVEDAALSDALVWKGAA
jgi:hypothetical protein